MKKQRIRKNAANTLLQNKMTKCGVYKCIVNEDYIINFLLFLYSYMSFLWKTLGRVLLGVASYGT